MNSNIKYFLKRAMRQGFTFNKILKELQRSEYFSAEQLENIQNIKLRKIIKHCYKNVPYYTELFNKLNLKPDDIKTKGDLKKLPFLDKYIIKENFDKFVARNKSKLFCALAHTSGTTGTPLTLYRDYYSINFENAILTRFYSNVVNLNSKKMTLRGQLIVPIKQQNPPFWEYNFADNELLMSSYHLSHKTAKAFINKIKEFNPKILHAYPSSAYLLAQYFHNMNEKYDFDAIFTSSEKLNDDKRKFIEETFNCKIYDEYGQAERVVSIQQCEKRTYHIIEDNSITEAIETEFGLELVGTNLNNYIMPLIRYKTGDTITSDSNDCTCGRHFRAVKEICGRDTSYYIQTQDGPQIIVFDIISKTVDNIIETQFVQEKIGELIINVTTNGKFSQKDKELIIKNTLKYTSSDINVIVNEVHEIPRGPNGKFINFIQKIQ